MPTPPPPTGPTFRPSPAGPRVGPPPRRNNTPVILGGVIAAAVALLLVAVVASGGGSDSGGGGGSDGGGAGSGYTEAMHSQFMDMCTSTLTNATFAGPDDNPCECSWNAIVDTVPADVFRSAMAAETSGSDGGAATSLPPEVQTQLTDAMSACLPSLPTTTVP
jgi:hypothetical protein